MTTKKLFIVVHNNTITRNIEFFAYNEDILEEVRTMTNHVIDSIDTRNIVLSNTTVRVLHNDKLVRRYYFKSDGSDSYLFQGNGERRVNRNTGEHSMTPIDYWEI